jgi:hypothetical protein
MRGRARPQAGPQPSSRRLRPLPRTSRRHPARDCARASGEQPSELGRQPRRDVQVHFAGEQQNRGGEGSQRRAGRIRVEGTGSAEGEGGVSVGLLVVGGIVGLDGRVPATVKRGRDGVPVALGPPLAWIRSNATDTSANQGSPARSRMISRRISLVASRPTARVLGVISTSLLTRSGWPADDITDQAVAAVARRIGGDGRQRSANSGHCRHRPVRRDRHVPARPA